MAELTAATSVEQNASTTTPTTTTPPTADTKTPITPTFGTDDMTAIAEASGIQLPQSDQILSLVKTEGLSAQQARVKLLADLIKDVKNPEAVLVLHRQYEEQAKVAKEKGAVLTTPESTFIKENVAEVVKQQELWRSVGGTDKGLDVAAALARGIPVETLRDAGVSADVISKAQEKITQQAEAVVAFAEAVPETPDLSSILPADFAPRGTSEDIYSGLTVSGETLPGTNVGIERAVWHATQQPDAETSLQMIAGVIGADKTNKILGQINKRSEQVAARREMHRVSHAEEVAGRKEEALRPYLTEGGYNTTALANDLKSRGLNQKAIQARLVELGFTPSVATDTASYAFSTPEEKFQKLAETGAVPAGAVFAGVDSAGDILYSDPALLKGHEYLTAYDWHHTPGATEILPSGVAEWHKYRQGLVDAGADPRQLDAEWRRYLQANVVAAREAGIRMPLTAPAELTVGLIQQEENIRVAKGIVTPIPFVGTAALWSEMGTVGRGISIAADVAALIVPVLPRALVAIRGLGKIRGVVAAERALVRQSAQLLELLPDKALVAPAKNLLKAQTDYIDDYLRVGDAERTLETGLRAEELGMKLEQVFPEGIDAAKRSLQAAQESLGGSESVLRSAQKTYVDAVGSGERFVSPEWLAHFESLKHDVVKWTQQLADVWADTTKLDATAIRAELTQVEKALLSAKASESVALDRLKTVASRWDAAGRPMEGVLRRELLSARDIVSKAEKVSRELLEDMAVAKTKLLKIGTEDITTVSGRLAAARESVAKLEELATEAKRINSPYLSELEKSLSEARGLIPRYEKETAELLELMRAEHLKTGPVVRGGRGGVLTTTRKPLTPVTSPVGVRARPKISPVALLAPAVSQVLMSGLGVARTSLGEAEFAKIATEVRRISESATEAVTESAVETIMKGVTPVSVQDITSWESVKVALVSAMEEATRMALQGKTSTEIEQTVKEALQGALQVETEVATASEVATVTDTVVKTATKIVSKVRSSLPVRFKPVLPVILTPRGKRKAPKRVPPGSIAWAQGWDWKYIPPPYTDLKPRSLGGASPIGAKHTGSNVPAETLQVIGRAGAKVPLRIAVDLGWTDIFILNGRKIEFAGGGLKTDVGGRISSPTQGMSVGGRGVNRPQITEKTRRLVEGEPFFDETDEYWRGLGGHKIVNRPQFRKKPKRRTRRKDTPETQAGNIR